MKTTFSRRELYALGEPIGDSATTKKLGGGRIYGMVGGGGGGRSAPTETTSTSYNTNVPEYARPYVETMLQGTQKQLFQTKQAPSTINPETGQSVPGATEITGFQPYKAYGGTYDEQGNQTSYDPGKAIAGFQPMQETAQRGIAGMQMPGEYGQASDVTRAGITAAMGNQYQGGQFSNQFQAPQNYRAQNFGNQFQAPQAYQAGNFGAQQVSAPGLQDYQMQGPADVNAPNLQQYQMGPAERVSADTFNQPGTASQYMSPYMQNVVDIQQREAQRQADIAGTQRGGQAARSGAFGGSRANLLEAEAARNLATQKGDIQATGQQAAFQNAQQQFNAEQNARMQASLANQGAGLTVGQQNLGAQLGIQQLGAGQNLQAQLANQGMGYNVGQQNLAARLGTQQFGAGQNLQAQLANQQQGMNAQQMLEQSRQFGAGQGMTAAQQRAQYGLAGQQAGEQSRQFGAGQGMTAAQQRAQYGLSGQQLGEQSRQFGANYGMQNLQAGMQGAQQLAGLGQAQLGAQQGIYNLQNTVGAQQQALEQQKVNQAMTDYANAQQYPLMQLGTMSNMLRGLPMQAQTTNQYAAAPNQMTQAIGTAGSAASLYNALKAKGGVIEEKKMASGGITSVPGYDVGGEVYADLMKMGPEELQQQIKSSSSEKVKEMAKSLLKQKQMAGGGIVAFRSGDIVPRAIEGNEGDAEAKVGMEERLAQAPIAAADGILGAGIPPKAPAQPAAPLPVAQAVQSATELTPVMKAIAAEQQTKSSRPLSAYTQEVQDEYKAAGVAERDPKERANLMAERANADDEAKRKKYMRMAEFFASWGSTPGPTLVAGLQAFKEKVPMLINDMDKAKQVRMEINKSIAGLDEATRLEKKGYIDEGVKRRQKEADKMEALNLKVAEIQEQEAAAQRGEKRAEAASVRAGEREEAKDRRYAALHKEVTQMKIDSDMELKKIDAAWHVANQNQASNTNLLKIWEVAQGAKGTAEAKIANIMRSPEYDKALRDANTEVTADSSPAVKKMQEDGKKALLELQSTFKTMRETADKTVEVMAKQLEAKGMNVSTANPAKGSTTPEENKKALEWANDPKSFGWTKEKADNIKKELGTR
jgi:hypothetical protein